MLNVAYHYCYGLQSKPVAIMYKFEHISRNLNISTQRFIE